MHKHSPVTTPTRGAIAAAALLACASTTHAQDLLWAFEGAASEDQFGTYLGTVGDVDGDGFADIIGSSRFEQATPFFDSPYVRVYSGRTGALLHEFSGSANEGEYGNVATGAGDVNGDGMDDILITSGRELSSTSNPLARVYVYSGADGTLLLEIPEPAMARGFGSAASSVGDIDGDGLGDFVVGARCEENCFGAIRAYSGATGALIWRTLAPERELLGNSLAAIGDVDGDGITDVAAGGINPVGFFGGRIRILSGATGVFLSLLEVTGSDGNFGFALAPLGDIDGDGAPEYVAGTFESLGPGKVSIVSAATGTILREHVGGAFESLGRSVAGGGDLDGDGIPDYAGGGSGFAAIYSGASGSELFRVSGENGDHFFGYVASVGDTNGDGFAEFSVGGPRDNAVGFGSGTIYVHGRSAPNGGTLCLGTPNSTGARGRLSASSPSGFVASADDVGLVASDLPVGVFGYFVVSRDFFVLPLAGGGEGNLCIAGTQMGRYTFDVTQVGASGSVSSAPSTLSIPLGTAGGLSFVAAQPGDTFNFQFWHRDFTSGGSNTFNFTDAVTLTFQ